MRQHPSSRRLPLTLCATAIAACLAACGEPATDVDGGSEPDGGAPLDATPGLDAMAPPDATPGLDAMVPLDATPDAPAEPDAGSDACVPSAELCNGLDDDCDGAIDEDDPGAGAECNASLPGICSSGTLHCVDGALECMANEVPSAELCNGLDDDCDGLVDEENPDGGGTCNTGSPGACGPGELQCQGGALECIALAAPSAEVCNGLDDDCNGMVDEGNPGGGATCATGSVGACSAGALRCQGGALECVQVVFPNPEACNGLDDDCDGLTDEGNPGGGLACDTGLLGRCSAGTLRCSAGALECAQDLVASTEVCNGLDDDCDGTVDDGLACP